MIASLIACAGAPGCGGDDASASPGATTRTARIGAEGGELRDDVHGVVVTFPPGALLTTTTVTMNVTDTHSSTVAQLADEGRALSEVGVWLTLTPSAFAPTGAATVHMRVPGPYDPLHSTKAVANADGLVLAIPSERSADGAGIVGTLRAETLPLLASGALDRESTLEVFATHRAGELGAAAPSRCVVRFDAASGNTACGQPGGPKVECGPPLPAPDAGAPPPCWSSTAIDLSKRRVALLVHGFVANLRDLGPLAAHLRDLERGQDSASYYDAVLGFQYSTDTAIADIGEAMARQVAPLLAGGTTTVDVFAHSMGVVVARYAMETASLGGDRLGNKVAHFVALGGPNSGLPFARADLMQTLLLHLPFKAAPALLDLMTKGVGGEPLDGHPFLTDLNVGQGADLATARYFSIAGDDHAAEKTPGGLPIGDVVHALYRITAGPDVVDDGLVATYSAQSDVLARRSMSWTPGPTLHASHFALHEAATFPTIDGLISGF